MNASFSRRSALARVAALTATTAALFRERKKFFQTFSAVFQTLGVVEAVAISRKANEVFHAGIGDGGDLRFVGLDEEVMMLFAVERFRDAAEVAGRAFDRRVADHRADEAEFFQRREIGGLEQVDGGEAHRFARGAEVVEVDFRVAPFAHGMVDAALRAGGGIGGGEALMQRRGGEGGGGEEGAAGEGGGGHGASVGRRAAQASGFAVRAIWRRRGA